MIKAYLVLLVIAGVVAAGAVGIHAYATRSSGISTEQVAKDVATRFNWRESQEQIIKVLRCAKGTTPVEWFCAVWVVPTSDVSLYKDGLSSLARTQPVCGVIEANVTAAKTKITGTVQAPTTCLFLS